MASGVDDDGDGALSDDEIDQTVYVCDGEAGEAGEAGEEGEDGKDSLVNTTTEPAGPNCEYGGTRVDAGVDDDGDGNLDPDEVDSTAYVCDGAPGGSTLVSFSEESAGTNCAYGGQRVDSGMDSDGDGTLDAGEVSDTVYVCNGDAGGEGAEALLVSSSEPPGANCADGGVAVEVGTDDDADGVLSASEVDTTFYVCDGADGSSTGSIGTIVAGDYTVSNSVEAALLDGVEQVTGLLTIDGSGMGDVALPDVRQVGSLYVGNGGVGFSPSSVSLPSLTTVDDSLAIYKTDLADWSGFDAITTVGGGLVVYGPEGTATLDLFPGLVSVGGEVSLVVSSEHGVTDIAGFDSLAALPSTLTLVMTGSSTSSTRISAFAALTSVGALSIYGDDPLDDLGGFRALTEVTGTLSVSNAGITDLADFAALTTVGGLVLSGNDGLVDLAGLSGVTGAVAPLSISSNGALPNLDGLEGISALGYASGSDATSYALVLDNNASLADIGGLSGVSSVGYGIMYVELNPSLCTSDVTAFRTRVTSGLESWSIGSNGGC